MFFFKVLLSLLRVEILLFSDPWDSSVRRYGQLDLRGTIKINKCLQICKGKEQRGKEGLSSCVGVLAESKAPGRCSVPPLSLLALSQRAASCPRTLIIADAEFFRLCPELL